MDVLDAIMQRRSINYFEPGVTVPDEKLTGLLELASLAPSSFNLQPWKVVIVRTPEGKKTLRRCAFDQAKIEEASAVFIMVADPAGVEENMGPMLDSSIALGFSTPEMRPNLEGMIKSLYGTPESRTRLIFAVKNTAILGMSIMLSAKALGLETHPMDGFDEAAIKKEFSIPNDKIIPMIIAVGHLKNGITLRPRAWRRPVSEFATFERF